MNLRVLSIQSHVVHGYVGNRSAVFPLQVLGIEVDYINSVQFSCHTGYPIYKGQVLDAKDLWELYNGLKANNLHRYTHVLTGYVGCASFLEAVADIVKDLKEANPDLKYYCDPVLGDRGGLYVPPDLIPVYKEKVLPLADVILPNQFEAELLSDCQITDEASALACIRVLHSRFKLPVVVISGTNVRPSSSDSGPDSATGDMILGYASHCVPSDFQSGDFKLSRDKVIEGLPCDNCGLEQIRLNIPLVPGEFTGTGDLFSALVLARLETRQKSGRGLSFSESFQMVISTMQAVICRTLSMANESAKNNKSELDCNSIELKLVQSVDDIRNPPCGDYVTHV
ncbi:unnamed protein product [Calicophoron daubneyi]|uniref:Pyridoxal kinase n=1 Tax=Calicophoron daubneyi TaxID=300641 RepID=A0AAV2T6I5_CALDB